MISYNLSNTYKSDLDKLVLDYTSKLGHPDKLVYSKDIATGKFTAILTYNTSSDQKVEEQESIVAIKSISKKLDKVIDLLNTIDDSIKTIEYKV